MLRKISYLLIAPVLLFSCGGGEAADTENDVDSTAQEVVETVEDLPTGPSANVEHQINWYITVNSCQSCSHANRATFDADTSHYRLHPPRASLSSDREVVNGSPAVKTC